MRTIRALSLALLSLIPWSALAQTSPKTNPFGLCGTGTAKAPCIFDGQQWIGVGKLDPTTHRFDLPFTQDGTGVEERTVSEKLKGDVAVTPFDYLPPPLRAKVQQRTVTGSDAPSITAALQKALDHVSGLGGGTVRLPAGLWRINTKVTASIGTSLIGDGKSATTLAVDAPQGVEFSGSANSAWASIRDMTVAALQTTPNDGTGFGVKFSGVRTNRQYFDLSNVDFRSYDGITRSYGFDNYIWVHDAVAAFLDRWGVDGQFNALSGASLGGQRMQNAVLSTGQTTQLTAKNFVIYAIHTGFRFTGGLNEGPKISDGDLVGVYYGIEAPGYNTKPGFWVNDVHINAVRRGIYVDSVVDASFSNLWIYRSSVFFEDTDWTALRLKSALARTNIKGLHTSVSISGGAQYGLWLEDCSGVTATNLLLSQTNRAIFHSGTNNHIVYDDVVFNGLSVSGVGVTWTSADSEISLGPHQFQGSVGTRYSYTAKRSIFIHGKAPRYNGVSSIQSISAAGTKTLTVGVDEQHQHFAMTMGAKAYTYNVDLLATSALVGDFFDLYLTIDGSSSPTLAIRNGPDGPTLASFNVTSFTRYSIRVIWTGVAWKIAQSSTSLH